jgi:hypothetical protein
MRDIIIELSLFFEIRSTSSWRSESRLRRRSAATTAGTTDRSDVWLRRSARAATAHNQVPSPASDATLRRGDSQHVRKRNRQQGVDAQPVGIRAADTGMSISAAPQQAAE